MKIVYLNNKEIDAIVGGANFAATAAMRFGLQFQYLGLSVVQQATKRQTFRPLDFISKIVALVPPSPKDLLVYLHRITNIVKK